MSGIASATLRGGPQRYEAIGELTFATVARLSLPEATAAVLTVDLQQITKADSAGLAFMFEWWRQQQVAHGDLQFLHLPARLRDLIRVNGLDSVFPATASA